ncbi:lipopolysaccharide core biosynthesis protein [Pseudomonas turukhanskensis]|uniref:LPS biosynthesis protein n=1 Tax=Pseudomonas turukhanskensis TaxID=1806536 RepID=A0A9W6K6S3_9PSED|nr:lipopolysaccharide core biosynthesis protein [Pseudomonas turukhanskensis]GLK90511.1 LPS biosynthesis protein [Pseudomonas turukhanskensis]
MGEFYLSNKTVPFERFDEHRNSCSGPVFILASGPSTKAFALEQYGQYPMMAVNGSICRFTSAGMAPDYYLCDDSSFVRNRLPMMLQAVERARHLLLSLRVIETLLGTVPDALEGRSVFRLERAGRCDAAHRHLSPRQFARLSRDDGDIECNYSWLRQKPNRIGFSRNLGKGYFNARTAPYGAIQLAYHLGFNQVFLVGLELSSAAGRFYEREEEAVPSRLDGDFEEYILPSFQLLAERVIKPQFQVYNLTGKSRLPERLIPKVDRDQLDALLARA